MPKGRESTSTKRALNVMDGKMTVTEISKVIFAARNTLGVQLNRMHQAGLIHIGSWKKTGSNIAKCYKRGPGRDAPRPEPLSAAERKRIERSRKDAYTKDIIRNRQNSVRRKIKIDPLTRAFFGVGK